MTTEPTAIAISVLIRSFNSEKPIQKLLTALKLGAGDEVIVVDSGSTDQTLAVAERHSARVVHAPPPFNYSKSLNLGFRAAVNPWVLVISSHTVPLVPDLLGTFRIVASGFPDQTVVAYGLNRVDRTKPYPDEAVRLFANDDLAGALAFCTNGNSLYRRSAWEASPFDETIRTGEDRAWLVSQFHQGRAAAVVPSAWTINLNQYSLRYMFNKAYSDCRAGPGKPLSLWGLFLSLTWPTRRFLFQGMPLGNCVRLTAHALGQFFGSRGPADNRPWT